MAEVCTKTLNEMYNSEFSQKGDNKREIVAKIDMLNREQHRTTRINEVASIICMISSKL